MRRILQLGLILSILIMRISAYGQAPTAIISKIDDVICQGDSAAFNLDLTGNAPWDVVVNNLEGESFYYNEIQSSPFKAWVRPEADDSYHIVSVEDKDGISGAGFGQVDIAVNLSTPVEIGNTKETPA